MIIRYIWVYLSLLRLNSHDDGGITVKLDVIVRKSVQHLHEKPPVYVGPFGNISGLTLLPYVIYLQNFGTVLGNEIECDFGDRSNHAPYVVIGLGIGIPDAIVAEILPNVLTIDVIEYTDVFPLVGFKRVFDIVRNR